MLISRPAPSNSTILGSSSSTQTGNEALHKLLQQADEGHLKDEGVSI